MIGTKEQAKAEFIVSEGEYNTLLTELGVARNLFTKEEFERFINLETEWQILYKKVKLAGNPEKLDPEDKNKYEKNSEEIGPFRQKIYSHFRLTKRKHRNMLIFQLRPQVMWLKGLN